MTQDFVQFIERHSRPAPYVDTFAENRERARLNADKIEAEAKEAKKEAEREEKERQNKLTLAARNIATPSTVSMFDSDYKLAQKMATYLRDNLDEMSKTPEGMRQFEAMSSQLTQMVTEAEDYYGTYYGTPEDDSSANTWMGAFKRMNDPSNPYSKEGMMDSKSKDSYEATLRELDNEGLYDFDVVDGKFFIKKGEQSMEIGNFQRPKDPFSAALEPSPAMSAQDWYVMKMPRNIQTREEAEMTAGALVRQDQRSQMDAARIYAEENDLDYKEVMKNPAQMQEAVDSYISDIADTWTPKQEKKEKTKGAGRKTPTKFEVITSDSSFSSNSSYVETGDPQMPYDLRSESVLTWPSTAKMSVSIGGEDSFDISSIRFDGNKYILTTSSGEEIDVSPRILSEDSSGGRPQVVANPVYEELSRQVDSNLGQSGSFKSIMDELYSRNPS